MSEKKQTKKKEKIRFSSDREGVKIVKVAAFCLAIVSWFATADGLYSYVFTENYTEALLISFGIQSILFVFNLKLPAYFSMIGDKAPDNEKTHRNYMFGKRKGEDKNTYRWVFRQKIIALLYVILIFASSWFSFVYISDFAYSKTRYIDANVELENTYRNSLSKVDKYINELTKCDLLIMEKRIAVLQQNIKEEDSKISRNDLITQLDNAQADYDEKDTTVKQKEEELAASKAVLNSNEWRTVKRREDQKEKVKSLSEDLAKARRERNKAKQTLEQAQRDLDNYKPPVNDIIHDFLVEITTPNPNSTKLSKLLSDITDRAIQYDTTESNYVDVVVSLQEFKIITNDYLLLRQLQSEDGANNKSENGANNQSKNDANNQSEDAANNQSEDGANNQSEDGANNIINSNFPHQKSV